MKSIAPLLALLLLILLTPLRGEERFLLAADNQVIEVNRAGKVTDLLKDPAHTGGIYDAWRLPDGGIAFAYIGGMALYDSNKKLVFNHPAKPGSKGVEANSCAVLEGGARFALIDSGACQIRVVDRTGALVSETPLPDLSADALHFRYRTIREVPGENAFWVAQYGRCNVLKIEEGTGKVLQTIPIAPLVEPSPLVRTFAVIQAKQGTLFVATSTGCQLLELDTAGKLLHCWTSKELGLSCRYFLGLQEMNNGHLMIACGDYHLKTPEESSDLLAEMDAGGKLVWKLTREQLLDQVEGVVEQKSQIEELRITNVHAYDSERMQDCLKIRR